MAWPVEIVVSVISGIVLALIVGGAQAYRNRRQVPRARPRSIGRTDYLQEILTLSLEEGKNSLEVMAPRLSRAGTSHGYIGQLQDAWQAIANRGSVRIVTRHADSCLEGALELAGKGMQVRVSSKLDEDIPTFHVFGSGTPTATILNDSRSGRDRPVRLDGYAPSFVFHQYFQSLWASSDPLEAAVTAKILSMAGDDPSVEAVCEQLTAQQGRLGVPDDLLPKIITNLAFIHGCSIVFVVGLPGAGKSYTRARIAEKLREMRIPVAELTDYVYAYRDFLHASMRLDDSRGSGFEADERGAFRVSSEEHLQPALRSLAQQVWRSVNKHEVTLVEFARADILAALREFGENIFRRAHVIYVQAPSELREQRLHRREIPPVLQIDGLSVNITVSDDHRLPSTVGKALYGIDDVAELKKSKVWQDRFTYIDNDTDEGDWRRIDEQFDHFLRRVTKPYTTVLTPRPQPTG